MRQSQPKEDHFLGGEKKKKKKKEKEKKEKKEKKDEEKKENPKKKKNSKKNSKKNLFEPKVVSLSPKKHPQPRSYQIPLRLRSHHPPIIEEYNVIPTYIFDLHKTLYVARSIIEQLREEGRGRRRGENG